MKYNQAILSAAGEFLGLAEWPGAKHNPQITKMFADVGHSGVQDDETPWCAAFVGSVLASLGLPHTGKLNARSYDTYGQAVKLQDIRPGDIVRLWRGSPSSWQGHVAFFVRFEGGKVILRGGNQGNRVSDAEFDVDRIQAIRRADGVEPQGKRPVIREGDRGAFVADLQTQLTLLGYTLGKIDTIQGPRSVAALVAFQIDNGLVADGVAGKEVWEALKTAKPRPLRDVTRADLKDSRTLKAVKEGKAIIAGGATIGAASIAVDTAEQVADVAQRAGSLAHGLLSVGPWPLLAIIVIVAVAFLAWRKFGRVEEVRIEDAQTGANDRR